MWLTTPRFLLGLLVLAAVIIGAAWAEQTGRLDDDAARWFYAGASLILMAAIVWRARARWRSWTSR